VACVAYFVLHLVTHIAAQPFAVMTSVSLWYPPVGVDLAFLIILGPRYVPIVLAANCAGTFIDPLFSDPRLELILPVIVTANYAAVALVVRRLFQWAPPLESSRAISAFGLIILMSPAGSALGGTAVLLLTGLIGAADWIQTAVSWWGGDLSGILTVLPAAIVFAAPWVHQAPSTISPVRLSRSRRETLLQAVVLLAWLGIVFGIEPIRQRHVYHVCFLPIIWIALRQGIRGATLATLAVALAGLFALGTSHVGTSQLIEFVLFELAVAFAGIGLGVAVTRRALTEARLVASEERLDRVIAGAQLGLWDREVPTGRLTFNRRWAEMLGFRPDEIAPHESSWQKLIHPEDADRVKEALRAHTEGRMPVYESEHRMRTKNGGWKWVLTRGSVVERDPQGRPLRVSGTHIDISGRKHAESEMRRMLQILEATPDFVATCDLEGRTIYANESFRKLRGDGNPAYARGRPLSDFYPEKVVRMLQSEAIPAALSRGVWHGETAMLNQDGREFPVSQLLLVHRDDDGQPVFLSTINRDISRQKQAEADRIETERKMLRAQKLESLGVLAGGIAHDFNNLLTAMLGNASLARLDLPPDSPAQPALVRIEQAAVRAADLCKEMLAYSGRSQVAVAPVDLSALVEDITKLVQVSISKKCVLKLELPDGLPSIMGDSTQIRQIVMNLVMNASDAIGERSGLIRICTGLMRATAPYLRETFLAPEIPVGDYVFLEVNDNGCGMSPEVRARIFEPFFTTKFAGHGLGLSAVLGIVRGHGGAIKVYSEPGRGTTFKLLFPALSDSSVPGAATASPAEEWRGSGLALVVDDEETVRSVAARMLEGMGFTSLVAADGREGVDLFREHAASLRLVLLDLTMPHMDGQEAFREINRLRPDVPIILMSGFTERDTIDRFSGKRLAGFIQKPFDRAGLQATLRRVLPARDPAAAGAPRN